MFHNCPTKTLTAVKYYRFDQVKLNVSDNSGGVPTLSSDMCQSQVITKDINITYTAMDAAGNKAECDVMVKIKGKNELFLIKVQKSICDRQKGKSFFLLTLFFLKKCGKRNSNFFNTLENVRKRICMFS